MSEIGNDVLGATVREESLERAVGPRIVLGSLALGLSAALLDILAIFAGHWMASLIYLRATDWSLSVSAVHVGSAEAAAVLYVALAWIRGLYGSPSRNFWDAKGSKLLDTAIVWLMVFAIVTTLFFLLQTGPDFSRGFAVMFFLVGFVCLACTQAIVRRLLAAGFNRDLIVRTRVALVEIGATPWTGDFEGQSRKAGLLLLKRWAVPSKEFDKFNKDLQRTLVPALHRDRIEEIIIVAPASNMKQVQHLADSLRLAPVRVRLAVDPAFGWLTGSMTTYFGDVATIELSREPLNRVERHCKRAFDIVVASAALFALSPLLLVVAAAIRLDTRGPVLYRQHRDGFNGRSFMIFKFRSMTVMDNGPVIVQARRHDPRITRVGAFIRRTSIDELPQLLNVLRGDMSIVGPRPHAIAHGAYFSQSIADYAHRHHVKPGLTGWAQVNGSRGETPTITSMKRRVDLDIWYISNWSFWLDVRIVLKTVGLVVTTRDAY